MTKQSSANAPELINPFYLDESLHAQIKQQYESQGVVQLESFFTPALHQLLVLRSVRSDQKLMHHAYHNAKPIKTPATLKKFIKTVTRKDITELTPIIIQAGSYQILHDTDVKKRESVEIVIDVTPWTESWGGNIVYVDGAGSYIKLPPKPFSITIANIKTHTRFIQYANHYAKQRLLLIGRA